MKKVLVLGAICLGASLALALPPAEEIGKARKVVSVLMADDVAALKAGKKTPVEVGDAAVALSKEAETEAMKYVLLKGALEYYVRGKDYDKAADAAEARRALRKDAADVTARRALAEWLAVSGDWAQALEAFIELGGEAGKIAQTEADKQELVAAADFYSPL